MRAKLVTLFPEKVAAREPSEWWTAGEVEAPRIEPLNGRAVPRSPLAMVIGISLLVWLVRARGQMRYVKGLPE